LIDMRNMIGVTRVKHVKPWDRKAILVALSQNRE
jgi:hypothetical protein